MSFTLLNRCAAMIAGGGKAVIAPRRDFIRKDVIFTGLYAISIPAAYVSVYLAVVLFVIPPIAYFLPDRLFFRRSA
jgi:hypothetical protein